MASNNGQGKPGRQPGHLHERHRPTNTPERRKGRRSGKRQIAPLYDTYGQPVPEGCYFDKRKADRAVRWIETNCRQFKGRWAGQPLLLMAWERRLIRHIFGWMNPDGTRLIREVYLEVPRKGGKSTLASALGLYLAYGDGENGPEVVFAATDKDQARVCYDEAKRMVEASPALFERSLIYASTKTIELADNAGGYIKALSSDAAKQFGLNLHGLVFDELMTQTNRTLWNALTTSEGAREQPLLVAISTAGFDHTSLCYEQHRRVEDVAKGVTSDPTFLGVIYGAADDADWTDEATWYASNPSLDVTVKADYYRAKCRKAVNMPTEQNAFRTLYLSQWVGQERRFIDMMLWDRNDEPVPEISSSAIAFGGLDLASTTDLAAFAALHERDGKLDIHRRIFIPEAHLVDRERRDRVPYRSWADEGLVDLVPGAVIDQGYVKRAVLDFAESCDLRDVGYDPWNASQLVLELEEAGIEMVKIRQGFASMSSATKELLTKVVDLKIRHGGDPVLRWCANNVAARTDPNENVMPDKARSTARIDPITAIIMALDGWMRRGREISRRSVYEDRGLVTA